MLRLRMMSVGMAACVMLGGATVVLGQGQQPDEPRQPDQPRQPRQPDRPDRQPGEKPGEGDQTSKWKVGEDAPAFNLKDLDGQEQSLEQHAGEVVVLTWWNPTCEEVERQFTEGTMQTLTTEFRGQPITFLAINSTKEGEEGGGRVASMRGKTDLRMTMPILLDLEGEAAKAYHVKKAPTVFVIDKEGKLVYAGAIDDSKSGQPARNNYLRDAITTTLSDGTVTKETTKVEEGCEIKAKMSESPDRPEREPRTPGQSPRTPETPRSPTSPD